jgi:hypothetical protein
LNRRDPLPGSSRAGAAGNFILPKALILLKALIRSALPFSFRTRQFECGNKTAQISRFAAS